MATLKEELESQLALIQARLAILNGSPEDVYPFGTVVVFAASSNTLKWHYVKDNEESWRDMQNGGPTKPLSEWILKARESDVGYFEVYVLTVAETPIYASPI